MTKREEEILSWIEENPLISQQELAKRANITRSSVGVHISNLMKKGLIQGKGYIISKDPYICVIGGVNLDIFGYPNNQLIPKDSNVGKVNYCYGGVGRNIAHCLKLLGKNVKLITAFGEDNSASEIKRNCRDLSIDIINSLTVIGGSTSTYLSIGNEDRDMEIAISDMEIYESVTPLFMSSKLDVINRANICVMDTNLPQKTIEFIANNITVPLFIDTVSATKSKKIVNILNKIHTLKPNKIEAEFLTGIRIVDESSLKRAAEKLLSFGIKKVFISLGDKGVFCADKTSGILLPPIPARVVNATGAGDCFMAALAWSYDQGYNTRQMACAGAICSSICVESKDTVSSKISESAVLGLIEKYNSVNKLY